MRIEGRGCSMITDKQGRECVDWSKVAVDTPVLVGSVECGCWDRGHFAKYENGKIYTWGFGKTSFTARGVGSTVAWSYAKLAEV